MIQSSTIQKNAVGDKLHDSLFFWNTARDFLYSHLKKVRNLSDETVKSYRDGLRDYINKFLIEYKKIPRTSVCIADCSGDNAREYMKWLSADRGLAPKTVCSRMNALRCYLEYASMKDTIVTSFYLAVKEVGLPKTDSGKIEYFESYQMNAVIESVNTSKKVGRRNKMMLVLLYDTATRAAELLDLTVNSLHLDADVPFVTIEGKGRKYRNIPLMGDTVKALRTYLAEFHRNSGKVTPLFYAITHGTIHKLSHDTLANLLEDCCKAAKDSGVVMPEHRHCHMVRKTRAMDLYKKGMPLTHIQQLLGHSSISTTSGFYAFATLEMLAEAMGLNENKEEKKLWEDEEMLDFLYSI